jgi:hypothetical protein
MPNQVVEPIHAVTTIKEKRGGENDEG